MDEERVIEEQIEEVANVEQDEYIINVENEASDITIQNDVVEAEVENIESIELVVEEAIGGSNLNIPIDHYVDWPNQHTIGAITGLREELDIIETLKTVESDALNHANYYLWEDENPYGEVRDGLFVTMSKERHNRIKICSSLEDEIGVTVSAAGFVGGQSNIKKDSRYGLVVHSGVVSIRCDGDVQQGDCVIPNDGVAKKTDGTYGYSVSAISKIGVFSYATISLNIPSIQMQKFSETVQDVDNRMDSAEDNIATAISVANAAYNKAKMAQEWTQGNIENIAGDIGGIKDDIIDINDKVSSVEGNVGSAMSQAQAAQSYTEEVRKEANDKNNTTNSHLHSLIQALTPDSTWVDPEGTEWNDYFTEYINQDGFPTTSTIKSMDSDVKNAVSMVSQTAAGFETIVSSIDKYSVGEWSQSYGLNMVESRNILQRGMIYIPTVEHDEPYSYIVIDDWSEEDKDINSVYNIKNTTQYYYYQIKLDENGLATRDENGAIIYEWTIVDLPNIHDNKQEFTKGYYYTWNGYYWVESEHPVVYFSDAYVLPSDACQYWYRDTFEELSYDGIIYQPYGLYKYEMNVGWVKVNVLDGNVTNRTISAIRQTANQISMDITNARSDIAALELKIDEDGARTTMFASVMSEVEGATDKLYRVGGTIQTYQNEEDLNTNGPGLEGYYYAVGTEEPHDVYEYTSSGYAKIVQYSYDGDVIRQPNTASILAAVNNEGDSSIGINADRINFTGYATFMRDDNSNITAIYGDNILSGYIISGNYKQENDVVYSGTMIDLYNGSISTPNFMLDQYGNVSIAGNITATSGYISGFEIYHSGVWYYTDELESDGYYYFIYDNTNYYFQAPNSGPLVFTDTERTLTCGDVVVEYDNRDIVSENTVLIMLIPGHSYIGYNQTILNPDDTDIKGLAGVYVAPDGIGLGNGNFYVDHFGNMKTGAKIDMYSNGDRVFSVDNGNVIMDGSITMRSTYEDEYGDFVTEDMLYLYNGNLTLRGNITLDGNITWGTNDLVCVLYSKDNVNLPVDIDDYEDADDDSTEWHKKYQSADVYVVYSYDGGHTWMDTAIKIKGQDGANGRPGKDANLHKWGIFDFRETVVTDEIVYSPLLAGKFGVANSVTGDLTGYMGHATGTTTYRDENGDELKTSTEGIAMHAGEYGAKINSNTTDPYMIVTDAGVKMSCGNNSLYVVDSGIYFVQDGVTKKLSSAGGGSGGTTVAVFG